MIMFFFNDTATTEIYTLSLHDALPIYLDKASAMMAHQRRAGALPVRRRRVPAHHREQLRADREHGVERQIGVLRRSEEHTSELQSRQYLVCRLLLEKKTRSRKTHVCSA